MDDMYRQHETPTGDAGAAVGHYLTGTLAAADSGIAVRQTAWHVWRWQRKKAVWFGFFPTEATALEAAGLQEQLG